MPFQYTFRADDISTWDVDTRDLLENRDRELELYSTTIDTSFLNLNASNLTSGTVPSARMTGAYTGITGLGTLTSLTIDGPSSSSMFLGDWNQSNNWSGIMGTNGYLLTGNSASGLGIYLRSESASHPVYIGSNNQNTLRVDDTSATVTGTMNATTFSGSFVQGTDYLSPYQGFRNKIINGGFEVWQRGTARTFMNAGQYLADRWTVRLYQQASHQRTTVTPVTGMQTRYALRVGSVTTAEAGGGARMWANTELESGDSIPLRGKTMTLSFWVRFSSATCSSSTATAFGNWSGSVDWCTSTTDAAMSSTASNGGSGVTLTNGSLPTTWTKYTTTVTLPSNINNVGVQFGFAGLGNTASADTVWYEVTQVQLEEGSVATPFEQRPLQTELALCQRYYYKTFPNIAAKSFGVATISTSTRAHVSGFFPVTMRVIPTALEQSGTANQFMLSVSSTNFVCSVVPSHSVSTTANTWVALFDVASGLTTGQAGRGLTHVTYGASAYLAWSAEL